MLKNSHGSAAALALVMLAGTASADLQPTYLQYFETEWDDIERRMPDVFLAGYNTLWVPPPSKASDPFSAGYDPFDRFDLGQPPLTDSSTSRKRTAYGTEATFRSMIEAAHRAGVQVHIDTILNHNSGRTESYGFFEAGGWPGTYVPLPNPPRDLRPTDNWGDFHGGNASGYLQSENSGAGNYSLWGGDLVALCDINQGTNFQFIRQPVDPLNPLNIPPGTFRNQPDLANTRFYPDRDATPRTFNNPPSNHSPNQNITRYPFIENNTDPGDVVAENITGYLMRWLLWMLEVQGVDGFRLDASKHTYNWFWDQYFDSAVYQGRILPDGSRVTPFSFGENTTGNGDILFNYFRKDGFANRDSLDLDGAGALRDLEDAGGFGTWSNVLSRHLDAADDGFQNGSAGVMHSYSHDNGTTGSGGSRPPLPTARQQGWFTFAYLLTRPGASIVYHNGRGVVRTSGFFPREGVPVAMGWDSNTQTANDVITNLVKIRNTHGYGDFYQRNANISDVLVFERSRGGLGSLLVAVNDRYDSGTNQVTVATDFPAGQRLHELTGNAADPDVDPGGTIPELITVGAGGIVTLQVPRNTSSSGEHNRGFVVYGPPAPGGTLTLSTPGGPLTETIPADPINAPDFRQRLAEIPVVSADSLTIRLDTFAADAQDNVADDNALFKIDDGFSDWNGTGSPDFPPTSFLVGGFEQFVDLKTPAMSNPGRIGAYEQTIDVSRLDEGFHYITVIAFRQRPAASAPIFEEWREVIYVDREPAAVTLAQEGEVLEAARPQFNAMAADATTERVHFFLNLPAGADPVPLISSDNRATRYDAREWRYTFSEDLVPGVNTVVTVAIEPNGRTSARTSILVYDPPVDCPADLAPPAGVLDIDDVLFFLGAFAAGEPAADLAPPAGVYDIDDVLLFLGSFAAGCP